ncbi:MAG: amidohydrolase family protein, partial [Actinomycetia bacterium]|nr:amidohydrolase family protein [Actinomycetes bacterium]
GSKVLGINSEGPYLNPDLGAQKKELVRTPEYKDYRRLVEASNGNLTVMTVAPELKGALELIKYLRQNNIIVSIGHTDIKIDKMHEALGAGITLVTHLLNAMGDSIQVDGGVKALGIQEELLICDQLMCEVLSDKKGVHVKPTLLKIILRCKGVENIILITDSMNMTGFPPGTYSLQDGRKAIIGDGEDTVRLEDGGLAGSVMTMDKAIGNFINHTGVKLEDAVRMATFNPAKAINFSDRKGEIREGMDADIAVFDDDIDVKLTIINGCIEYNNL